MLFSPLICSLRARRESPCTRALSFHSSPMLHRSLLALAGRQALSMAKSTAPGLDSTRAAPAALLCLSRRSKATRTEYDTFGPLEVPADK